MDEKWILLVLLSASFLLQFTEVAGKETEVRAHAGTNVTLPCRVDIGQCGILHSVKWYRDTSRIYVFSQAGQVARAEGDATERMTVEYNETGNETLLKIAPVEVEDEAIYKCEITYLEVRENCDVVQIVKLTTLVKPMSVRVLGIDGVSITNSTKLPAKNEGSKIEVICEAMGGKPIPTVSWYNGTQLMNRASYSTHEESNGVGTGVSKLQLTLSRGDLNARFECRVESQALDEPIISWITVDVNVKPTKIDLSGVKGHVVQGSSVMLMCDVHGARPAATVKWFNGSTPIDDKRLIQTIPEDNRDGTYTTKSTLVFVASRWENGRTFNCYAENEVTKSMLEPALHKLLILDVRFPPVVKVGAARTILNETEKIILSCTYFANPQRLLGATWFKDGKELNRIRGKHENGNVESPSLNIKNVSRDDIGDYTCWLRNEVGEEESDENIYLDVHYPPNVEVIMEPSLPVKAVDRGNVTLECNVTSGNPPALQKVRWFLDGELMTELRDCNYTLPVQNETLGGPFCGIDPSILSLIKVEQSFAGNYTCQGENEAGYGPESEPQELIVYYPPTAAKLRYYPSTVIKKAAVTLECTVDHTGRPENVTYMWYRGGHQIHNITVSNWTIQQASLETRSNFTCIAKNEGGQSAPATVGINVLAPPAFIGNLNSYKGVLYSSNNVSLTCRVECSPLCSIIWFKDGYPLSIHNNPLYYINNTVHPADYNKNDFESMESSLVWNMTNWPNHQLNKSAPHSHYTCASISQHDIGSHVNFTTEIAIDFPPEDLSVSKILVNVIENEIPASVKCSGKGRPKLSYVWKKNLTSEPIVKDDTLQLDKMQRSAAGVYLCEAFNKYGNQTVNVYFNVQYKPDCSIEIGEREGNPALICVAKANPQEVSFTWKIRESNDSIDLEGIYNEGLNSYLLLDSSVDVYRTYQCIANNTVGASIPCERYVPGIVPWYKRLGRDNLIIIIASIIALIICVIIVCIVIIILCRRKRASTKCNNPLEMEEREKPDGQSPDTSGQGKWPLKPGVLVHVSKMHHINISQLSPDLKPFKTTSVQASASKSSTLLKFQRNKSKVYARLQRLKDLLGYYGQERVPSGISECTSGVVTYKKIKSEPYFETGVSRKRKKPGSAPNPSSTGDKMRLGPAPPVGGSADPINDPDKGFYENLPFHGMQNPPNKPISVIAPFTTQKPLRHQPIQRHQSFHGFQSTQPPLPPQSLFHTTSNPYLAPPPSFTPSSNHQKFVSNATTNQAPYHFQSQTNFQPLLNFNPFLLPNPFSVPSTNRRVVGRRESDIRRTITGINKPPEQEAATNVDNQKEDKKFGSLDLRQHKCYSPTFYSMRCRKHAKKRPIIYALPKKIFGDLKSFTVEGSSQTQNGTYAKKPVPIPRCKRQHVSNEANSSNSSENLEAEVSIIEAQVHSPKEPNLPKLVGASPKASSSTMKNSPMLKVSPNFIKPKVESPKGALQLQIEAKRKGSVDNLSQNDDAKENFPLIPKQMPLLGGTQSNSQQNAFYTLTTPHYKHLNIGLPPPQYSATIPKNANLSKQLLPRALFNDQQLPKSKSFNSKANKHKKHFQIPLQKCNSFKFQTAESFFQPIKNIHEADLMRNGCVADFSRAEQRAQRHKPKQRTKGPLVVRHGQLSESVVPNSLELQYPQPIFGRGAPPKPNGVVYADLDMQTSKGNSLSSSGGSSKKSSGGTLNESDSSGTISNKKSSKPKTEYATLTFNDIGQEIDV